MSWNQAPALWDLVQFDGDLVSLGGSLHQSVQCATVAQVGQAALGACRAVLPPGCFLSDVAGGAVSSCSGRVRVVCVVVFGPEAGVKGGSAAT